MLSKLRNACLTTLNGSKRLRCLQFFRCPKQSFRKGLIMIFTVSLVRMSFADRTLLCVWGRCCHRRHELPL